MCAPRRARRPSQRTRRLSQRARRRSRRETSGWLSCYGTRATFLRHLRRDARRPGGGRHLVRAVDRGPAVPPALVRLPAGARPRRAGGLDHGCDAADHRHGEDADALRAACARPQRDGQAGVDRRPRPAARGSPRAIRRSASARATGGSSTTRSSTSPRPTSTASGSPSAGSAPAATCSATIVRRSRTCYQPELRADLTIPALKIVPLSATSRTVTTSSIAQPRRAPPPGRSTSQLAIGSPPNQLTYSQTVTELAAAHAHRRCRSPGPRARPPSRSRSPPTPSGWSTTSNRANNTLSQTCPGTTTANRPPSALAASRR